MNIQYFEAKYLNLRLAFRYSKDFSTLITRVKKISVKEDNKYNAANKYIWVNN